MSGDVHFSLYQRSLFPWLQRSWNIVFLISLLELTVECLLYGGQGTKGKGRELGSQVCQCTSCVTLSELFNLSTPTWSYLQNEDNYIYLAGLLSEVEVSSYY